MITVKTVRSRGMFKTFIRGTLLGSICLLSGLALFTAPTCAEPVPAVGTLLVASPALEGSGFSQSVVLLIQHDENGTMGLIINQPTQTSAVEMLPKLKSLQSYTGKLYIGGPVAPWGVIMLVQGDDAPENAYPVIEGIYSSGDQTLLQELSNAAAGDARVRLYAGHAGWLPGQLDAEILRGSWLVIPAKRELVFSKTPLELWESLNGIHSRIMVQVNHE